MFFVILSETSAINMYLLFHQTSFPVSELASSITYYHSYSPSHEIERMLPDGHVDFVVNLTDEPKHIFDNQTLEVKQICNSGWISGARTGLISIDAGMQNDTMMVVRLRLGAALSLFKIPSFELTDQVIDAELILGSKFFELREQLLGAKTPYQKIEVMEKFLLDAAGSHVSLPPVLQFAFESLINEPHQQAVKLLARQAGYSHKHLISLFRKYAGITPKELMKVLRFQKVVDEIEKAYEINWSQVAFDCGYYDQAHFIKEFKHFSGYSPVQYLEGRGEHMNYLPVR